MKTLGVIGAGVSGLTAAYYLKDRYKVTIIEANSYLGGHTNTISINDQQRVDTGFIVFNEKNYPLFCKLLQTLGVKSQESDMSFGYSSMCTGIAYSSDMPFGLFANKKQLFSVKYWKFLAEIKRFNTIATESYLSNNCETMTILEFCEYHQFSMFFQLNYVIPMGAAIWSASFDETTRFPARSFLQFWYNHCLLQINDRPVWRTITNGSKSYIEAMENQSDWTVICNEPVKKIERQSQGVDVYLDSGKTHTFDHVILGTHADQSLNMLLKPSNLEKELLGKWSYSSNHTVLHTDTNLIPKQKSAWASWMVREYIPSKLTDGVSVTYLMNRLQRIQSDKEYLVSLNAPVEARKESVIRQINYQHPIFNKTSLDTQDKLSRLNEDGPVYFCGAYFGYGFHEDGVRSGVNVARRLGAKC